MPTQKARLNLTLDDDLQSVIDDIARITKTPKARIITDILRNAYPALNDLRNALLAVEQQKDIFPPSCENIRFCEYRNRKFEWRNV